MEFDKLLEEIDRTTSTATIKLDEINPRARPGMEVAVREAKDHLEELKTKYGQLVQERALGIFVLGNAEGVFQFASIAEYEGDTITLESDSLYRELARSIEQAMGDTRVFGPDAMSHLVTNLRTMAFEMGIVTLPVPKFEEAHCSSFNDTIAHVKKLVRLAMGDDLNSIYLKKVLVEKALKIRYTGSVVPVVVISDSESEIAGLSPMFQKGTTVVNVADGDNVTKEYVLKVFSSTKKKKK